ncbi:MAG: hypothetical protein ACTHMC_17625 [Pseudobacter sp.]|uniref:hypothetical protein n=1 Tax=Pseudobacter sp. TaxID=2045420 RepID=UPI003F7D31EF
MNDSQKKEIIEAVINEVEDKGSARVGYHAEIILKRDSHSPVSYSIRSKIEGTIVASKKYKSRPHPKFRDDYEIIKNHDYEEKNWIERNPVWNNFLVGLITAVFSLIVGWLLLLLPKEKQDSRIEQLEKKVKAVSDSISILKVEIEKSSLASVTLKDSSSKKDTSLSSH